MAAQVLILFFSKRRGLFALCASSSEFFEAGVFFYAHFQKVFELHDLT